MASLTDKLPEPNNLPIDGSSSRGSTLFGDFADVGTDLLNAISAKNRAANSGPRNDPGVDEAAMGIFQSATGIDISTAAPTGTKEGTLQMFARLQKAKDNGAISQTMYDVRVAGEVASAMRNNPNEASEILSLGKQLGFDGFYFREAFEEQKLAENALTQDMTAINAALTAATSLGIPPTFSQEERAAAGFKHLSEVATLAKQSQELDLLVKQFGIDNPRTQAAVAAKRTERQQTVMRLESQAADATFSQLADLYQAAKDSPERMKALDEVFLQADLGLMQFEIDGQQYMDSNVYQYKDATGTIQTLTYDQKERDEFTARVNQRREMLASLRGMEAQQAETVLKRFQNNAKMNAEKQLPTLSSISATTGLTITAFMTMLADHERLGIDMKTADSLVGEFATYVEKNAAESAQNIAQLTKDGAMPSGHRDPAIASKAFVQNSTFSKATAGQILNMATGKTKFGDADRKSIYGTFEAATADVLGAMGRAYNPANITNENTKKAMGETLNRKMFDAIATYKQSGGDFQLAKALHTKNAQIASTFYDGFMKKNAQWITYDKTTGTVVPAVNNAISQSQSITGTASQYFAGGATEGPLKVAGNVNAAMHPLFGGLVAADTMFQSGRPEVSPKTLAATANELLNLIDYAQELDPIVSPDLLKASKVSLRDLVSEQSSFDAVINKAGELAAANVRETSDQVFKSAAEQFQVANPFAQGVRPGGGSPFDDEDSWISYRDKLRGAESGGNPTAKAKDSSAFGVDQFLDSTWLEFASDEPEAQGLSRQEILALRSNPEFSEKVLFESTAYNADFIQEALDRKVTAEELSMAHFSGPEGAVKVLKANPADTIDKVLGSVVSKAKDPNHTNHNVFWKGEDTPKTVEEFLAYFM